MPPSRVRVVDVVAEARSGAGKTTWTYLADADVKPGDALLVPLGSRALMTYALRVYETDEEGLGFPIRQLRRPLDRPGGLDLPEQLLSAVRFVANEFLCPLPVALGAATPPGATDRIVTTWRLADGSTAHEMTPLQKEVLQTMSDNKGILVETKGKRLPASSARALKLLEGKGVVEKRREAVPLPVPKAEQTMLRLTPDDAKVEKFLTKDGKRKPAQVMTVMRLQGAEQPTLTREEIRALCGVTDQTIRALLAAGLLQAVDQAQPIKRTPPEPNEAQAEAIRAIVRAIDAKSPESFLLYGVTGSGKTEVFLRAAAEALRKGRQVLYLVPEIALATQAIAQLRARFGDRVSILHSEMAPGRRLDHWLRVRSGESPVVIGARSAVFAPLNNLGLIVLDEEHEGSYKQDTAPRYHAKTVALELARLHECPLVLGSATPNIETFFETRSGVHTLLTLPVRAASAQLPTVLIDDLREGYRTGQPAILAPELYRRMEETLARKEQVILFLNRRAYSPFLICRDCGEQFKCPRCSVSLSYSRQQRRLRCHHCDFQQAPPSVCPVCGGLRLSPMGIGTEKVEEAVQTEFPTAVVARLDRDISRRKGAVEDILARVGSGEVDVLVGTQIVAKGLDFPNVTLVGVITADLSLNIPDFRASERTFQLLSQVAGRAGRGTSPGFVVVQTFNPDHLSIQAARDHDYERLYAGLIEEREAVGYPPFKRLVNVLVSGENISDVRSVAQDAADAMATIPGAEVLGPVDAALERLHNRWRRHVLVKFPPDARLSPLGERLAVVERRSCVLAIDVDPYSLV